jgi:hypothetical protein
MGIGEHAPEPGEMFERAADARFVQSVAISARRGGDDVGIVRDGALMNAREAVVGIDEAMIEIRPPARSSS